MKSRFRTVAILLVSCLALFAQEAADLESSFKTPPAAARPLKVFFALG
jgi:hypothetical protein